MNNQHILPFRLSQTIASQLSRGTVGVIFLEFVRADQSAPLQQEAKLMIGDLAAKYPGVFGQATIGDDMFLYVNLGHGSSEECYRKLELTADAVRGEAERLLRSRLPGEAFIRIGYGCSLLEAEDGHPLEGGLFEALKKSIRHEWRRTVHPELAVQLMEFETIMRERSVSSVYQPIVSLADGSVFGYEALARGPESSPLYSPLKLFDVAEQANKVYALDKLTREQAILGCGRLGRHQRIFLNIPAHILHDPAFSPGQTLVLLQQLGLSANNVVFEITERSSIEDFSTAKKVIDHYRSQGYSIAIDDAGAGYSSLQAIAEIQPDFIKVDRSLITGIHKDKVKEYILETFIQFSKRLNIMLIAEGIEEADELSKLIRMGVHFAQGYYLGRPARQMKDVEPAAKETILSSGDWLSPSGKLRTIGDIVIPAKTFPAESAVSEAAQYFRNHGEEFGAVVVEGDRPLGLLMREELFRMLSAQYGYSLYWNKPLSLVIDEETLFVEANTPIETVSQLAMMRDTAKLYDLIVVTEQDKLAGVVTVRDILDHLTNIRMENARVANPLTGLAGNTQIQRELQRRIMDNEPFAVLYIDLDYFKWFNDQYGFQRGDEVIQFTADIIRQAVSICGEPLDFVGHIGGDDFIVLSSAQDPIQLCNEMIRRFHSGIWYFYEGGERVQFVEDRYGNRIEADGLSLSLALVRVEHPLSISADTISQCAAECKRKAKEKLGSAVEQIFIPASGWASDAAAGEA